MAKAGRRRSSDIKRRRAIRDPKRRFLMVCEDTNSAPPYFDTLAQISNTIIDTIPGAGTPEVIAQIAIEKGQALGVIGKKRKGLAWFERTDEVWAVFDRDQHHHFERAVSLCNDHGIKVARSNPCFEVWMVLHLEDFNKPHDRHQVFEHLCDLMPAYKAGKGRDVDYSKLITALEAAEDRAEKQLAARENEGSPFGAPSTTVYKLTKSVWKRKKRASYPTRSSPAQNS